MDKIIEKAISGGLIWDRNFIPNNGEFCILACNACFWSSLGKACGWYDNEETGYLADGTKYSRDGWLVNALQFHELNLTTSFEETVAWLGKVVEG